MLRLLRNILIDNLNIYNIVFLYIKMNIDIFQLFIEGNLKEIIHRSNADLNTKLFIEKPDNFAHIRKIIRSPNIPSFLYIKDFYETTLEKHTKLICELEKPIEMAIKVGSMYLFNYVLTHSNHSTKGSGSSKCVLLERLYLANIIGLNNALYYEQYNYVGWFTSAVIKFGTILKNEYPKIFTNNDISQPEDIMENVIKNGNEEAMIWILRWFMSQNPQYFQIYIFVQNCLRYSTEYGNKELFLRAKNNTIDIQYKLNN
jgi:hypothetical protein